MTLDDLIVRHRIEVDNRFAKKKTNEKSTIIEQNIFLKLLQQIQRKERSLLDQTKFKLKKFKLVLFTIVA